MLLLLLAFIHSDSTKLTIKCLENNPNMHGPLKATVKGTLATEQEMSIWESYFNEINHMVFGKCLGHRF